jgi:hypothetical protein
MFFSVAVGEVLVQMAFGRTPFWKGKYYQVKTMSHLFILLHAFTSLLCMLINAAKGHLFNGFWIVEAFSILCMVVLLVVDLLSGLSVVRHVVILH